MNITKTLAQDNQINADTTKTHIDNTRKLNGLFSHILEKKQRKLLKET
jgi:hypothetical protein